jgi:hypothetical protein
LGVGKKDQPLHASLQGEHAVNGGASGMILWNSSEKPNNGWTPMN